MKKERLPRKLKKKIRKFKKRLKDIIKRNENNGE